MALTATAFNYVLLPTLGAVVTSAGANTNIGPGANHGNIIGKQRIQRLMLTLDNPSNGAAYPTSGGIPLSTAIGDWGMKRNLDYVVMTGHGYNAAPTGPVTNAPVFVHANPPTGGAAGYIRAFGAMITGVGPSAFPTMRAGLPELPTTWTPTLSVRTHAFYFVAYGW